MSSLDLNAIDRFDPEAAGIIAREDDRQRRKLIFIASESFCPPAVKQALTSTLGNIYAEGWPHILPGKRAAKRTASAMPYGNRLRNKGGTGNVF